MSDAYSHRRNSLAQDQIERQLTANLQSPSIEWTAETRERLIAEVERRVASRHRAE